MWSTSANIRNAKSTVVSYKPSTDLQCWAIYKKGNE